MSNLTEILRQISYFTYGAFSNFVFYVKITYVQDTLSTMFVLIKLGAFFSTFARVLYCCACILFFFDCRLRKLTIQSWSATNLVHIYFHIIQLQFDPDSIKLQINFWIINTQSFVTQKSNAWMYIIIYLCDLWLLCWYAVGVGLSGSRFHP